MEIKEIVICASMVFSAEMLDIKRRLEENGHKVIVPLNTDKHAAGLVAKSESRREKEEHDCIRDYCEKIKEADAILVLNKCKKGIPGYIGGNTLMEMGFAHVNRKKIFLWNPPPALCPEVGYVDEIMAMPHTVLNGDLSLIKK